MQRQIKSYVMRAGRVSNRQQQGLELWLSDYELVANDVSWDYSALFHRHAEVIVEIGFGMGHSLFRMAAANPHLDYIGIEVHRAGIGSLVADLHEHQLANVRVVSHDAVQVLRTQCPDNSLSGIQIFFPDPWHKKRHHKRRLIQKEFIQLLIQKLKPQGFIHCATDWQNYAEHMLTLFTEESELVNQNPQGGFVPRPESRPLTKFEQRGNRLGHGVWDLMFIKK